MAQTVINSTSIRATGTYADVDRRAANTPVRAADATRERFSVEDRVVGDRLPVQARDPQTADDQSTDDFSQSSRDKNGTGVSLLASFTAYLSRIFGQDESDGSVAVARGTTSAKIAARAYRRATEMIMTTGSNPHEVFSSFFPRLSSGRTVDLSV